MDPNTYQKEAARTLIEHPGTFTEEEIMILWNSLGLAGEAGEVTEIIKKAIFHRHGLEKDKLIKELGDVMWYLACLCTELGLTVEEVMEANVEKLRQRYPHGFGYKESLDRKDVNKP